MKSRKADWMKKSKGKSFVEMMSFLKMRERRVQWTKKMETSFSWKTQ